MRNAAGNRSAIVVGAGIGGLTAAVALRQAGFDVTLCERSPHLRAAGFGLAVQSNAMHALRTLNLGLDDEMLRAGGQVTTFSFRDTKGKLLRRLDLTPIDDALGAPSVVLARRDLHDILLRAAGSGLRVEAGAEAVRFTETDDAVVLHLADGRALEADVLVGADGINSVIRTQLHGAAAPRPGGFVCWLALAPFMPAALREGESIHYWGRGSRFGLHDCGNDSIYWWATMPAEPELAANWPHGKDDLQQRFADWCPDANEIIARTDESAILAVPALDRPPLSRWGTRRVTLLGDAAHPMLPSLGQGANSAIEDAVVLGHALAGYRDPRSALQAYERRRLPRTTDLVDGSLSLGRIEQSSNRATVTIRSRIIRHAPDSRVLDFMSKPMTWPGFGDGRPGAGLPRPLSALERWHWTADRVSPLNIGARVRIEGRVDPSEVRAALDALVRRHPLLRVAVRHGKGGLSFVPGVPRAVPLRLVGEGSWRTEIDHELREPLDADGPLLRATLITVEPDVHDLILTSTYALADGIAIVALCRQMLEFATDGEPGGWRPEIPAPAGPEDLMPNQFRGLRGKCRALGRMAADAIAGSDGVSMERLPAETSVPPRERCTRLANRVISGDEFTALLEGCRTRRILPEAAIATALAMAAAVDTDTPSAGFAVSVSVPFRAHLTRLPDPDATGSYQAMVALPVECTPGRSLWQTAEPFDDRLRNAIDARHHLANLPLLGAMAAATPKHTDRVVAGLDGHGPGNLCTSVVDSSDFPARLGDWSLSGVQVVSGMSISGYLVLYATVGRDELSLNLGYVDGIISPARAEELIENTASALRSAVSEIATAETAAPIGVDTRP